MGRGKKTGKVDRSVINYASKIKDDVKHEYRAIAGKIKASHAILTQLGGRC